MGQLLTIRYSVFQPPLASMEQTQIGKSCAIWKLYRVHKSNKEKGSFVINFPNVCEDVSFGDAKHDTLLTLFPTDPCVLRI